MFKILNILKGLGGLVALITVGCVEANNPYDMEAPAHLQLEGKITGRVILAEHDFDAQTIQIQVLDQTGAAVQDENGPIVVQTRKSDSALPEAFEDEPTEVFGSSFAVWSYPLRASHHRSAIGSSTISYSAEVGLAISTSEPPASFAAEESCSGGRGGFSAALGSP